MSYPKMVRNAYCPCCGRTFEGTTQSPENIPRHGSFTICVFCLNPLVFHQDDQEELYLRRPNPQELLMLNADPKFYRLLIAILKWQNLEGP